MVALIGADEEKANAVCDQARENDILVPANFNAPGQVVISGSATACDRAEAAASELGMRATRLAVAGAFHSPFMQPAADQLAEALASTQINAPNVHRDVQCHRATPRSDIRTPSVNVWSSS